MEVLGAPVAVAVLGPLRIETTSGWVGLRRNQRASLFATLLCNVGQVMSYEALCEEFDTSADNVMKIRGKLVRDLRQLDPVLEQLIISVPDGYLVRATDVSIDADELRELVEDAEAVVERDPTTSLRRCESALQMWNQPYQGVPPTNSIDTASVELELLHRRARATRCRALLATGSTEQAVAELEGIVADDPDDEGACHDLAAGLSVLGRRSEALDVIKRVRALHVERGTVIAPALRELEQHLLLDEITYQPTHGRPVPEPDDHRHRRRPLVAAPPGRFRFVGHRIELDQLRRCAADLPTGGPSAVFVEAFAGMGKTWLLEEFAASAPANGYRQCWLEFHENDDGPFRRVVEEILRETGADMPAASTDDGQADPDDPVVDRVLVDHLLEVADGQPLVVIADDLHWADGRCLEFLDRLVGEMGRSRSTNAQLLLVATTRPTGTNHPLAERLDRLFGRRSASRIELGPLDDLEVHELLRELGVPRPGPELVKGLQNASAGNPLAIRRIVGDLFRNELLFVEYDVAIVADDDVLRSATTVDALARRTFDDLSERCRSVLRAIAVLGNHADVGLIEEVGGAGGDVRPAIAEAVGHGVVSRRGALLRFDHPSLASAALASTSGADLQAMHARAARAIDRSPGLDEAATTSIADHLIRAGPIADGGQVAEACREAGMVAMGLAAWSDADRYFSAALAAAERIPWPPGVLAEIKLLAAQAAFSDHQTKRAAALFDEVATYGRNVRDMRLWGQAIVQRARATVHDLTSFDSLGERAALEEYLRKSDRPGLATGQLRAQVLQRLATLAWSASDYASAAEHAEAALGLVSVPADAVIVARSAMTLGLARMGMLQLDQALKAFDSSMAASASTRTAIFSEWGRSRSAQALWMLGELEQAARNARRSFRQAEDAANWAEASLALAYLAGIEHAGGRFAEAERHADASQRLLHRSSYVWAGNLLLPVLVSMAIDVRDDDRLREIEREWASTTDLPRHVRTMIAIHRDDRDQMLQCAERFLARRPADPTIATLPSVAAAAELAAVLGHADLARWSLVHLRSPAAAEIIVVPGFDRSAVRLAAGCHRVLGEDARAGELLLAAIEDATLHGLPLERARAKADLAGLVRSSDEQPGGRDPAELLADAARAYRACGLSAPTEWEHFDEV